MRIYFYFSEPQCSNGEEAVRRLQAAGHEVLPRRLEFVPPVEGRGSEQTPSMVVRSDGRPAVMNLSTALDLLADIETAENELAVVSLVGDCAKPDIAVLRYGRRYQLVTSSCHLASIVEALEGALDTLQQADPEKEYCVQLRTRVFQHGLASMAGCSFSLCQSISGVRPERNPDFRWTSYDDLVGCCRANAAWFNDMEGNVSRWAECQYSEDSARGVSRLVYVTSGGVKFSVDFDKQGEYCFRVYVHTRSKRARPYGCARIGDEVSSLALSFLMEGWELVDPPEERGNQRW